MWACGAAGSALPWHGRGHRFDPDQVHQLIYRRINHLACRQKIQAALPRSSDVSASHQILRTLRNFCAASSLSFNDWRTGRFCMASFIRDPQPALPSAARQPSVERADTARGPGLRPPIAPGRAGTELRGPRRRGPMPAWSGCTDRGFRPGRFQRRPEWLARRPAADCRPRRH